MSFLNHNHIFNDLIDWMSQSPLIVNLTQRRVIWQKALDWTLAQIRLTYRHVFRDFPDYLLMYEGQSIVGINIPLENGSPICENPGKRKYIHLKEPAHGKMRNQSEAKYCIVRSVHGLGSIEHPIFFKSWSLFLHFKQSEQCWYQACGLP